MLAEEFENGDVGNDQGNEEENGIDGDNEGKFVIADVRRGEAVEPDGVEEAEEGDEVADGDVSAKGANNGGIILFLHDGNNRVEQAIEGDEGTGKAEGTEHQRKGKAHGRKIDGTPTNPEERGDKEAEINGEIAKSKTQKRAQDDVH